MFERLLAHLARADVAFVVVGGLAVAQAGYARFTEDVDLLVRADRANVERLIGALGAFGEGAGAELTPDDFPLEEGAVRVLDDAVIDLFTVMSGLTYADLRPLAHVHDVSGEPVAFLSAEGLIRLKADSLRPKDRLDVLALRDLLDGRGPA